MNYKTLIWVLNFSLLLVLFVSCAAPIDYFGNNVNLYHENIYLSDLRDHKKDKYILVFKGQFNRISQDDMDKRNITLNRYIKLIKEINGFSKSEIISEEIFGVISPRYYVTIQFY